VRVRRSPVARGIGSRTIVIRSIEFAEMSHTNEPSVGGLCRAWGVSGSRLRQAFVDVFDLPPTKFFQQRLLGRLRDELGLADPTARSVTDIAASLGVTDFGRAPAADFADGAGTVKCSWAPLRRDQDIYLGKFPRCSSSSRSDQPEYARGSKVSGTDR